MILSKLATVTSGASKTLPEYGVTVPSDVVQITLLTDGAVHWNFGTASASTPAIPTSGISVPVNATELARLQFYGAGATFDIYFFTAE